MISFLENRPVHGSVNAPASRAENATGFQPLMPSDLARPAVDRVEDAHQAEAAPQIELVRNGGRIERIIVTCSCCNRIELDCRY